MHRAGLVERGARLKNKNRVLISNHLYQVGRDIQAGYYLFSNEGAGDSEHPDVHFNMYPERPPVSRYQRSSGYFGVTEINSSTRYIKVNYGQALYYGKPFNLYETLKLASLPDDNYRPADVIVLQNELCTIKVYKQDSRTHLYHGDGDTEVYEQYLYSINEHKFWAGVLAVKSYRQHSGFLLGFVDTGKGQHYRFENGCCFADTTYSSRETQIRLYRHEQGNFVEVELPPNTDLAHIELEWIRPQYRYMPKTGQFIKSGQCLQELYSTEISNLEREFETLCALGIDVDIDKEMKHLFCYPDLLLVCSELIHQCMSKYPEFKADNGDVRKRFTFPVNMTYNKQYYCAAKLADVAEDVQSDGAAYWVTFRGDQIREISLMYSNLITEFGLEDPPWSASVIDYLYHHDFYTFLSGSIQKCLSEIQEKYGYSPAANSSVLVSILKFLRTKRTRELDELYSAMLHERRATVKWGSEYSLFVLIKQYCPNAIYQYRVEWLRQQSFDIFLPNQKIAIEYQGKQHYEAINVFGGETSLAANKERDKRKRMISMEHGVKVLDWKYDIPVSRDNVLAFLDQHEIPHGDPVAASGTITNKQANPMAPVKQKPVKAKAKAQDVHLSPFVIRQFDTDGKFVAEYSTLMDAAQKSNISERSIRKAIYGERKTGGGFMWQRCPRESEIESIAPVQYAENTGLAKKVLQLKENGELIAEYASIGQAEKQTGIGARGISAVLSGNQKTAGGYIWRYVALR